MQGVIKQLNNRGHTEVAYDTDVPESVEVAMAEIRAALDRRSMLFDGQTRKQIPISYGSGADILEREQILEVPPMAGG